MIGDHGYNAGGHVGRRCTVGWICRFPVEGSRQAAGHANRMAVQEPDRYRAAVSIAGVTDWASVLKASVRLNPYAEVSLKRCIGDPRFIGEAGGLDEISPLHLADRIKAPVLLIHGRDDPVVPHDQASRMAAALIKAANPPERLSRFNEPHGIYHYKNRMTMYALIEDFLGRHLAPRAAR